MAIRYRKEPEKAVTPSYAQRELAAGGRGVIGALVENRRGAPLLLHRLVIVTGEKRVITISADDGMARVSSGSSGLVTGSRISGSHRTGVAAAVLAASLSHYRLRRVHAAGSHALTFEFSDARDITLSVWCHEATRHPAMNLSYWSGQPSDVLDDLRVRVGAPMLRLR